MPRLYLMTWVESQKRWTKMHKGQRHYVSCKELSVPESKGESWQAANDWWRQKMDQARPPKPGSPAAILALLNAYAGRPIEQAEVPAVMQAVMHDLPTMPDDKQQLVLAAILGPDKLEGMKAGVHRALEYEPEPEKSVGRHAANWKVLQEQRVKSGSVKASRAVMNKVCLDKFISWFGEHSPAQLLDEAKWQEWYQQVLSLPHGLDHKKRIWQVSKNFVRYLAEHRVIDIPRNLESRLLTFKSSPKEIEVLTLKEVREFLGAATIGQTKLHALLMLNCGMLAKDISDLKQTDVDWKKGIIERKRSKTVAHDNVPVVKYQLWPETFQLLKKHRSKDKDRVLLTKSGRAWVEEELTDGEYRRADNIASCFKWVNRKLTKKVSPKVLRATAATFLGEHPQYKFYGQYFLGHSPRSIADKHYIQPSEKEFFEALEWLRKKILA